MARTNLDKIHLPKDGVVPPSIRLEQSSTRIAPTTSEQCNIDLGFVYTRTINVAFPICDNQWLKKKSIC